MAYPVEHSSIRRFVLATLLAAGLPAHAAPVPLPSYNVDIAQTSVSGLSSGGFMAVQLHVAFSSTFKAGAGIVAGGPYYCAQGAVGTATGPCMAATSISKPATATLVSTTNSWASQGLIDPTGNLANSKVYLYSGTIDSTVKQLVMNEADTYYKNYIAGANIFYKNNLASEHAMVTDYFGSGCSTKASPYINNCNFDLAGEILKWIYGPLNARNSGTLGGSFVEYNQAEFIASPPTHGMAASGWAYVPASCGSNQQCKLHVVVHGCQQDPTKIQDKYYRSTGYNKWADTNNIIMLYPQTAPSSTGNPNGCWDWWGYDDANYAKKSGRQMAAIKGMVDRVTGGFSALPAPAGLNVSGVTDDSVTLAWSGVSGAAGYNVYRSGSKVNASVVTALAYTDTGLASGSSYSYTVKAVTAGGSTGAESAAVNATTSGSPPPLAIPANLAVTGQTGTTVSLAWSAASGATGYHVYRDGAKVNATPVSATSYTDSGLAASTSYSYAVTAFAAGRESALSAPVSATTTSGFVCTATTSSNYAHVTAGRAVNSGGYALAKGSNQNMGLNNTFYTSTLAQTSAGYYIIGNCL
ncbi:fibronectin type III domain-containing protein [Pseudoduganella sp. LjRoot289]|uniref:extracellular catalytic domain type 2 short-chain-length polyhydroxyalkanoate depolymerase n=1 Tax=Pseudoduganella sp. LjRoot289 TaxID=3342314 RepID=UPI003ECD246D